MTQRCECMHSKESHYEGLGKGCGVLTSGGFPCRCTGFVPNKEDILVAVEAKVNSLLVYYANPLTFWGDPETLRARTLEDLVEIGKMLEKRKP